MAYTDANTDGACRGFRHSVTVQSVAGSLVAGGLVADGGDFPVPVTVGRYNN